MTQNPTTIKELFEFYHNYVKPLYSAVQVDNVLPTEVLFELNATLDHISRIYAMGASEPTEVEKAYSHLKRSCLDIFKLAVKKASDEYTTLHKYDIHIIDNGDFVRGLVILFNEIKKDATHARSKEGDQRDDSRALIAFELWEPVYHKCILLHSKYYMHPRMNWAKTATLNRKLRELLIPLILGFLLGIGSSLLANWIERRYIHHKPAPNPSNGAVESE